MPKYDTTDPEFLKKNLDSFTISEELTDTIAAACDGKHGYIFIMIDPDAGEGAPLYVASNMEGEMMAGILAQAHDNITQDPDIMASGEVDA